MVYCPKCLSDEISRTSTETIRYSMKAKKTIRISSDDKEPKYFCTQCANTFNSKDAKEIATQIHSVWTILCNKHKWNPHDTTYKIILLESIHDRECWNNLFQAVWNETMGDGYIEWEWTLTYKGSLYNKSSAGAISYMSGEDYTEILDFDKVRWNPNWQYIDTSTENIPQ